MAVVWCPDWPIVAWGVPSDEPAAVMSANRVIATSAAARAEGVAGGQRRRQAQSRCPQLTLLDRNIQREARLFEPIVETLESLTPRIEITGPGLASFPTRGPSRFHGGDQALAELTAEKLSTVGVIARMSNSSIPRATPTTPRIGVADGSFAARLAARSRNSRTGPVVVEPGASAAYLAPVATKHLGIEINELADLADVFLRLGLENLGMVAALEAGDVLGRFGLEGQRAHRLARGEDPNAPDLRQPAAELSVAWEFDPPATQTGECVFVTKMLADELHQTLEQRAMACTRMAIEVETESGLTRTRMWRHEGTLSAGAMAERARWQLEGWLGEAQLPPIDGATPTAPAFQSESGFPTEGIVRLSLIPDEVTAAKGRQLGFWGEQDERAHDVTRVVARLQSLLGSDAVSVPEYRGGIGPGEQVALVPATTVDLSEKRPLARPESVTEPWPGKIPAPAPTQLLLDPTPVELLDTVGRPVGVSGRGELSGTPALLHKPTPGGSGRGRQTLAVTGWAGPWPADQRWWDPFTHRRQARLQLTGDDGTAYLLSLEQGLWTIEAIYN